jgi:hypothetical protein
MERFHSAYSNIRRRLNKYNYRAFKLILCGVLFDGKQIFLLKALLQKPAIKNNWSLDTRYLFPVYYIILISKFSCWRNFPLKGNVISVGRDAKEMNSHLLFTIGRVLICCRSKYSDLLTTNFMQHGPNNTALCIWTAYKRYDIRNNYRYMHKQPVTCGTQYSWKIDPTEAF